MGPVIKRNAYAKGAVEWPFYDLAARPRVISAMRCSCRVREQISRTWVAGSVDYASTDMLNSKRRWSSVCTNFYLSKSSRRSLTECCASSGVQAGSGIFVSSIPRDVNQRRTSTAPRAMPARGGAASHVVDRRDLPRIEGCSSLTERFAINRSWADEPIEAVEGRVRIVQSQCSGCVFAQFVQHERSSIPER